MIFFFSSNTFGNIVIRLCDQAAFCSGVAGGFHNKACLVAFQPVCLLLMDGSVDFNPPDSIPVQAYHHLLCVNEYLDEPNTSSIKMAWYQNGRYKSTLA